MERYTFGFRGLAIDVSSNVAAPLVWLQEFMLPALRAPEVVETRKEIRLVIDERRHASMLSTMRDKAQGRVDCFTKDGSFEQAIEWRGPDGRTVLFYEPGDCFLVPQTDEGRIELVAVADHGILRRTLMRLVRELAMIHAMYRGDVFLHAAAVEYRGAAIGLTGVRRSGKTSMLINALRQPGVRYLANDRLFLEHHGDDIRAHAMPTIIAIRAECLDHLPGLALPAWEYPYRHYLTMDECASNSPLIQPASQNPPAMNPAQFCQWLGVGTATRAPLRAIILPQVDSTVRGHHLERHSGDEACQKLSANLFSSGPTGPIAAAFAHGWDGRHPTTQRMQDECRTIADRCAVVTCRIGPQAFGTPNVWDQIVSDVF